MNFRIVQFSALECVVDSENVTAALNQACQRDGVTYSITGVCQSGDTVFFPLEEERGGGVRRYQLAPIAGGNQDALVADLKSRWQSGFRSVGMIRLGDNWIGLFQHPSGKKED